VDIHVGHVIVATDKEEPNYDAMSKEELTQECKTLFAHNQKLVKQILHGEPARLQLLEDVSALRQQVKELKKQNKKLMEENVDKTRRLDALERRALAEDKDRVFADIVRIWTAQTLVPEANSEWRVNRPPGLGEGDLNWSRIRGAMGVQEEKVPDSEALNAENAPIRYSLFKIAERLHVSSDCLSVLWDINDRRNDTQHNPAKTEKEKKALKEKAMALLPTSAEDSLLSSVEVDEPEVATLSNGMAQVISQIKEIRTR